MDKKKILSGAAAAIATAAGVHVASMLTIDKTVGFKEICFASPKIRPESEGLSFAFVTDLHNTSPSQLRKIVDKINERGVDAMLLGGDYGEPSEKMKNQLSMLTAVKAPLGVYGVDGNHDAKSELYAEMRSYNMKPLGNEGTYVSEGVYLAGVEDFRKRKPDIQGAIMGAKEDDLVILLSHNPDVAAFQNTWGVDLMLAGHTHGGQANVFGMFSPFLQAIGKTGQRFRSGWSMLDEGGVAYVSNGVGTHHHAPRVFARPQVIFLTLQYFEP